MSRRSKSSHLDISIRGDELENRRIQLEHELQHTAAELSFKLSSVSDEEGYHNHSVEYPRHNSGPAYDEFSFEHASRDHFDDTHSQIHPYSYRTDEGDGGIRPYLGGETLSTAAHHASALTLSAGLGGGRSLRRDASISGAEYDPDRPLQDIMAGVNSKLSVFDIEPSRSRYPGATSMTFDPLVADNSAELDRVLQSGYVPPPKAIGVQSPLPTSSPPSSDSEHERGQTANRPKLSDSLRKNVTFSPKRPRNTPVDPPAIHAQQSSSKLPPVSSRDRHTRTGGVARSTEESTPRPKRRTGLPSLGREEPEVRPRAPTPSVAESHFTRVARGLTKEIQQEQHHVRGRMESSRLPSSSRHKGSLVHPAMERNPPDVTHPGKQPNSRKASALKHQITSQKGKVYLPDVTGITTAVESPAKMGLGYYTYKTEDSPREIEARLITTLNTVQTKLQRLEDENGVSRRRVRELEMELEVCKRDVARERTRVLEREEIIAQQHHDATKKSKGKARARDLSANLTMEKSRDYTHVKERYKEAVEEKKALEALITTLRTHLTRLTAELSSHKELLMTLRELRESDVRSLKQKGEEIEKLKEEVERLAGEVEVLRGVVEEGLKERRNGRVEALIQEGDGDLGMSHDVDEEGEDADKEEADAPYQDDPVPEHLEAVQSDNAPFQTEDGGHQPFERAPISEFHTGQPDRTMRTDYATLGSNNEYQQVDGGIADRRLQDSPRRSVHNLSSSPRLNRRATVQSESSDGEDSDDESRAASPSPSPRSTPHPKTVLRHSRREHQSKPPATARLPINRASAAQPVGANDEHKIQETPFPQIRGEHLERLFFSAPEHNERTCNVCRRRGSGGYQAGGGVVEPSWIPQRFLEKNKHPEELEEDREAGESEDEGFVEGSEQYQLENDGADAKGKGVHRERVAFAATVQGGSERDRRTKREGSPPQTVITKVIRELEDDFTHYKGIYVELADQYKIMDAVSDVPKRNVLAKHLKEVVDVLEQKGDQIAALYETLTFKDKPISESILTRPLASTSNKMRNVSTTAVASSSGGRKAIRS